MRLGIDLMGSDSSPHILFEAVLAAAEQLGPSTSLIVFATPTIIDSFWLSPDMAKAMTNSLARIELHSILDFIEMHDEPLHAVRRKKNASIMVAMHLLKSGFIDAFISAGNTGALIAAAALTLTPMKGIQRPALLAQMPTIQGNVVVIDVGGNINYKASHLVQYALLGVAYQKNINGIKKPAVGLLNIGTESKKGTYEVRLAYELLQQQNGNGMHFIGNIEGREVFQGKAHVLVTDGFTGNVFLKTTEGVSTFILQHLQQSLEKFPNSKELNELLANIKKEFHYEEYSGALVCGVKGIVIKCHGLSSTKAMLNSIFMAAKLVQANFYFNFE